MTITELDRPAAPSLLSRMKPNLETLPTLAAVAIFIAMLIYGEIAYGRIVAFSTISNLSLPIRY